MDLIVNGEPKQVSNEQLHLVLNELGYLSLMARFLVRKRIQPLN